MNDRPGMSAAAHAALLSHGTRKVRNGLGLEMLFQNLPRLFPEGVDGARGCVRTLREPQEAAPKQPGSVRRADDVEHRNLRSGTSKGDRSRWPAFRDEAAPAEEGYQLRDRGDGHTRLSREDWNTSERARPTHRREPLHDPESLLGIARIERAPEQVDGAHPSALL